MRLQLRGALLVLLCPAAALAAEVTFASKVQVYTDDDATTVVSPHARITGKLDSGTGVDAAYTEDIVSSASVDVRSSASPRIHDRRQEVDLGVSQELAGASVGLGFVHSAESDYRSTGGSLSASRDFAGANTSIALRGGYASNVVGKSGDPAYAAPMNEGTVDLAVTQTLSEVMVAQLAVTGARGQGMFASPYRKVSVEGGRFVVPEAEPPERTRLAGSLGVKRAIGFAIASLSYRLYTDSFGLLSHTADLRATLDLSPRLALRLRYRFYVQNGASFYRSSYDVLPLYVVVDRELSPFASHLAGAKLDWTPAMKLGRAALRLDLKVEGMYFAYADFPALKQRKALTTQAGLTLDF